MTDTERRLAAVLREAVIRWNTIGTSNWDVSDYLAAALLPVVAEIEAEARAGALREFADWWEDPTNADELRGLADRHYSIGGPSMPAIVARLRADAVGRRESDMQRVARDAGASDDHPWVAGCGCWTCTSERVEAADGHALFMPMCVCADCGNKRCPRATHHDQPCSGSNEPGQGGSRYA